jgi:CNT family concentrative nucleoside transporter
LLLALLTSTAFAGQANLLPHTTTLLERLTSFAGLFIMVGMCWAASERRDRIDWRPVGWGMALQFVAGLIVLSPVVSGFFYGAVNEGVNQLLGFSDKGAQFVFGTHVPHIVETGDPATLFSTKTGTPEVFVGTMAPGLKNFAFSVLPTIVFFSALMSVLYQIGVMQVVVRVLAAAMVKTMGTSGAESLSAAGNIFVGQTEAPLLVRPFVPKMTRSELMAVMVGGFATVAGGVMGAYVKFLDGVPNIAGHLMIASIMSAPASLAVAKLLIPETEEPETRGTLNHEFEKAATNVVEAAALGAADGVKLAINVAGMLLAFVGLVAMADWFIGLAPVSTCGGGLQLGYAVCADGARSPLTLSTILGVLFFPMAVIMGVPWGECFEVGRLLGEKMALTEFVAYIHLGEMINAKEAVLSERGSVIASYALCGFANFASIGIQLGGIGGIAPERMKDLAEIGFKAMIGGTIAACMTGAVVGVVL